MVASPEPKFTLRVKDQGGGPVIHARFRMDATQAELAAELTDLQPARSGATGLCTTPTQPWAAIFRRPADTEPDRRDGDCLFDSIRHWPFHH